MQTRIRTGLSSRLLSNRSLPLMMSPGCGGTRNVQGHVGSGLRAQTHVKEKAAHIRRQQRQLTFMMNMNALHTQQVTDL